MPSYAGAVAAMQQRLRDHWTTTDIGFQNGPDPIKANSIGDPLPWVYFEVLTTTSALRGGGSSGIKLSWIYIGFIYAHVFVPVGSGDELAQSYATQIGEVFRAARFYDVDPMSPPSEWNAQIRSWAPRVDGGDAASDDGVWWGVTMAVDFEFYMQA